MAADAIDPRRLGGTLNEQNGVAEARHAVPRRPPPRRLILGSLAIAWEATLHTRGVASLFVRGVRSLPSAS